VGHEYNLWDDLQADGFAPFIEAIKDGVAGVQAAMA
jgi:hypothetical protein